MDDAHERHSSSISVLQVLVKHCFDFGGTITAQIEFEIHGATRGRHDDRSGSLLCPHPAKALERSDGLPGLERAKHDVGYSAIDGDDLAFLVEGDDSDSVPSRNRFSAGCRRRRFQFFPAEPADLVRGLIDFASSLVKV